ncbi:MULTISPECIES: hypothetical protein [Rhizobium]|uniref:hypothetical protein n=1 Tax=Rhizobium TaxID=379 RepID=UPI0007EB83C9|nr:MULTISPECIES: hypothetical protein [Rhizobium]
MDELIFRGMMVQTPALDRWWRLTERFSTSSCHQAMRSGADATEQSEDFADIAMERKSPSWLGFLSLIQLDSS